MEAKKPKLFEDFVVELNVGGTLLSTLRSTLKEGSDSMLADILSGRQDKNGRYFIDCDGEVFKCILDFLRFGTLPREEKALEVYVLAARYKIQSLLDKLGHFHTVEYRRKIDQIKVQLTKDNSDTRYEEWKRQVVEDIRSNAYCSPREDITLYETESAGGCDSCPLTYARIFLRPPFQLSDDWRALLLYDLCELGYGKFTIIKKIAEGCESCKKFYKGKQIILLKQ